MSRSGNLGGGGAFDDVPDAVTGLNFTVAVSKLGGGGNDSSGHCRFRFLAAFVG